jgi:hypothetical protein
VKRFTFLCIFAACALPLFSQSVAPLAFNSLFKTPSFERTAYEYGATANGEDRGETPLWVRDLRRAEIVMFGSFPLSLFFSSFVMDTFRWFNHDKDNRYAPWPFKSAGAIDMNDRELKQMFAVAVSTSVGVALLDFGIVRYKRYRQRKLEEQSVLNQEF